MYKILNAVGPSILASLGIVVAGTGLIAPYLLLILPEIAEWFRPWMGVAVFAFGLSIMTLACIWSARAAAGPLFWKDAQTVLKEIVREGKRMFR